MAKDKIFWIGMDELSNSREWAIIKDILNVNKEFGIEIDEAKDRIILRCKNKPGENVLYGVNWKELKL